MSQTSINAPATSGERRRHQRAPVQLLVDYEDAGRLLTGTAREVSEGGLRLELAGPTPVDAPVRVTLPLRGRSGQVDRCELTGRIVRREGGEIGVAFDRLLPRHMLQLRDYVWRSALASRPT